MIFDGYDEVVGLLGCGADDLFGQRLNAVGINDGDADALILQRIGGL